IAVNPNAKSSIRAPESRYPAGAAAPPMARASGATPAITVSGAAAATTKKTRSPVPITARSREAVGRVRGVVMGPPGSRAGIVRRGGSLYSEQPFKECQWRERRTSPVVTAVREATVRDVTVWTGGTVWTGEGDTGALAAAQGRIVAVGAEAEALAGKAAEVVDLDGGLLMPSFGDGHAHPLFGGLEFQGPPVRDLADPEQVAAAVGRWAAEHPGAEWIVGGSYDPAIAPRGEFDARVLDAAVPDRPVVLRAYDYHTVWVTSEALRRAGITADTPDPDGGTIVRRADGTPMGTL